MHLQTAPTRRSTRSTSTLATATLPVSLTCCTRTQPASRVCRSSASSTTSTRRSVPTVDSHRMKTSTSIGLNTHKPRPLSRPVQQGSMASVISPKPCICRCLQFCYTSCGFRHVFLCGGGRSPAILSRSLHLDAFRQCAVFTAEVSQLLLPRVRS